MLEYKIHSHPTPRATYVDPICRITGLGGMNIGPCGRVQKPPEKNVALCYHSNTSLLHTHTHIRTHSPFCKDRAIHPSSLAKRYSSESTMHHQQPSSSSLLDHELHPWSNHEHQCQLLDFSSLSGRLPEWSEVLLRCEGSRQCGC